MAITVKNNRNEIIERCKFFLTYIQDSSDDELPRLTIDLITDLASLVCGKVPK